MNRHELELISALAEGTLEDETEARLLIASSPELRAEYEAQKTAIEAFRQVPMASLTEHERSGLRRDVWTQLRAQPGEGRVSTPWYYRWSTAAAGLVLVVGLVAVLNQTDSPVAESLAAEEVSAEAQPLATDQTSRLASDAAGADDSALAKSPTEVSELAAIAAAAREGSLATFSQAAPEAVSGEQDDALSCSEQAGLEDHEVIGQVEVSTLTYIVVAPRDDDIGVDTPISFVDAETCELIYTDG